MLNSFAFVAAMGFVALHPAPFEAVVWASAQSELLAAALLLVMLHCWLGRSGRQATGDRRVDPQMTQMAQIRFPVLNSTLNTQHSTLNTHIAALSPYLLASLALALALLAKESAVIGLPLLALLGWGRGVGIQESGVGSRESRVESQESGVRSRETPRAQLRFSMLNAQFLIHTLAPYALPTLITLAYLALQVAVERRNYLLAQGGYGLGPQLLLNPLRSLALLVAPLPGSEHADAAWLVPVGALVALALLALLARGPAGARRLVLALGLTLLPTAPFASPPDSRYLYLPVLAAALLAGFMIYDLRFTISAAPAIVNRKSKIVNWWLVGVFLLLMALAGRWAAFELHEREWRFAAAAGPGGSLWRLAGQVCATPPERLVLIEPPIAPPHAEAIVALACGADTKTLIVGRGQAEAAIEGRTVMVGFPGGTATVERE